jgi:hypothetical protein
MTRAAPVAMVNTSRAFRLLLAFTAISIIACGRSLT